MTKDPAFLFYPQDWLTGTMTMPFDERGKYITILALMHQQGRMSEETICFLVGSVSVILKSKFKIDENGFWYNERLEKEIEKRAAYSKSRYDNGKKGGRPKKEETEKKPYGKPRRNHMVNHMGNHTEDVNEIEDVNEKENKNVKSDEEIMLPWNDVSFVLMWSNWKKYKLGEHRFKYKTHISEQMALKELCDLSEGHCSNAIKIIEKSISKGWKGFFKLTKEDNATITVKSGVERESEIDDAINRHFGR